MIQYLMQMILPGGFSVFFYWILYGPCLTLIQTNATERWECINFIEIQFNYLVLVPLYILYSVQYVLSSVYPVT